MAQHKYNRHVPKALPTHRMLQRVATSGLSETFDGRAWAGPVKDQGQEGSCTGNAGVGALEWVARKYFPQWGAVQFSAQYTYENELIRQGSFPQDVGSDGVTLCESLIGDGCCPESLDPYVAGQILKPTQEQTDAAKPYRMGAYHGLVGSQTAWSVLADATPWPVLMGFTVYESFEGDWPEPGVMPLPDTQTEQVLGGHEVLVVGCDMGDIPTLRPNGTPASFLVRNSWGAGWGLSGDFWCPAAVLDFADTDLKIAHTGHAWLLE